jgi:hypothetical protein
MNANAGDTLLVHGSATTYGTVTVKKRLVIIGAGYFPRKERPIRTRIESIALSNTAVENANGSIIKNCSIYNISGYYAAENIVVQNNELDNISPYGNNWLIEHNIIRAFSASTINVCIVKNNLFLSSYYTLNATTSCVLTNNLFANISGSTNLYAFASLKNAIVTNNIFYGISPFLSTATTEINTNSFNNNLTFSSSNNTFVGGTANTVGNTNLINQNPLFNTSLSGVTQFNYNLDFRLQASSPGRNIGTDGTDIGMFGGTTPMTYPLSGEPKLGIVKSMNITNTVVPVGGTLNVKITAKTRN